MAVDTFEVNGAEAADFSTSNVKPTSAVSRVKIKNECARCRYENQFPG